MGAVCGGLPFPLIGILFGEMMDELNTSCGEVDPHALHRAMNRKVVLVFCAAAANFVLIYVYMGCWSLFGERLVYRIRYAYLQALLRQDMCYFDTLPAGEVTARLDADVQTIQSGMSEKVGIFITTMSYFVTAYVMAYSRDARLTTLLMTLVPAYFLMSSVGGRFTKRYTDRMSESVNAAISVASECLSNISIIHAFGAEDRFEARFASHLSQMRPAAVGKFVTGAVQLGTLYFIVYAANALAIWQGSKQIADSVIRPDSGVSFGDVYSVILLLLDGKALYRARESISDANNMEPLSYSLRWRPSSPSSPLPQTHIRSCPRQ